MTTIKAGDTHRQLIIKHWGKWTPEIDKRITRLNHLNKKKTICAGKKYLYTPQEIKAAEIAIEQKTAAYKTAKAEERRLKEAGFENIVDVITKFNESSLDVPEFSSSFLFPLEGNKITSSFGDRKDPIGKRVRIKTKSGKKKWIITRPVKFHRGIDVGGVIGENIPAANDGKVIYANSFKGYGDVVVLGHQNAGKKYFTIYAHCSDLLVKEGDLVNKGQTIAKLGSSGRSTGPHLHFELRLANGENVDPLMVTQIEVRDSRSIAKNVGDKITREIIEKEMVLVDDAASFYKKIKDELGFKSLGKDPIKKDFYEDQKKGVEQKIYDTMV